MPSCCIQSNCHNAMWFFFLNSSDPLVLKSSSDYFFNESKHLVEGDGWYQNGEMQEDSDFIFQFNSSMPRLCRYQNPVIKHTSKWLCVPRIILGTDSASNSSACDNTNSFSLQNRQIKLKWDSSEATETTAHCDNDPVWINVHSSALPDDS